MPGHDRIRFIDPASYESPSAFEGLTSLLTTLNTFEQQKKAEERQDEVDKENQRRYAQTREDLNFEREEAKRLELKNDKIREDQANDIRYNRYVQQAGGDIETLNLMLQSDPKMIENTARDNLDKIKEQANAYGELNRIIVSNPLLETTQSEYQAIF